MTFTVLVARAIQGRRSRMSKIALVDERPIIKSPVSFKWWMREHMSVFISALI
jgi:hypothetical protein